MNSEACIVLANGQIFKGSSFGASGAVVGETVFTTGMTGYLETLTDPSYYGQIVVQTFPLIGNYGVIESDFESAKIHLRGYIVRDLCGEPSNFRCGGVLNDFLKKNGIVGLCGIDTRRLTKILREAGVMNGMLVAGDSAEAQEVRRILEDPAKSAEKEALLEKIRAYRITDAVQSVAGDAARIERPADVVFETSAAYRAVPVTKDGLKVNDAE
ncbi:MAG: carbamoyl phosphate synthase small subunit, partial [Treponemataceae bacterium]|nr:carbamoyl phosphate synthase small subunit [Treponemataceae bacterium]